MGTKVQSKTPFPGSVRDLNSSFCNVIRDVYHDDRTYGSENGRFYDSFLMRQPVAGYTGYAKEHIRQTILKQESIFRNQLQELHRLYKRQRDLMNELTRKEQQVESVHNLSTKRAYFLADLNEPIQVEETSFSASVSNKNGNGRLTQELQRRDLPANSESGFCFLSKFSQQNRKEQLSCNFTDGRINQWFEAEPRKAIEHLSFPMFDQNKPEPQMKRTIFGVEIPDSSRQIPEFLAGNKHVNNSNLRLMSSSRAGVPYQNGGCIRSSMDNLEELRPTENDPERKLPPWLMANPSLCSEQVKRKETALYQMNLDSLQNHSQQFFKKAEMSKDADKREIKKVKTDDLQSTTKILGVSIVDVAYKSKNLVRKDSAHDPEVENLWEVPNLAKESCKDSNLRRDIDLNLSLNEDEAPPTPSFPDAIDLEAPAVLESEPDSPEIKLDGPILTFDVDSKDTHVDLSTVAAEAIMSISSSNLRTVHNRCQPPEEAPDDTLLLWFADVITSRDEVNKNLVKVDKDSVPEGMDDFEYMTLKLQDTKDEYCCYKPMILEVDKEKEAALQPKRTVRKGRGRQRKDFQRDILPSIVSLSRREVSEDLQTFEEVFTATGVSWQSSLSKRKAAAKSRSRRHLVVPDPSSHPPPPPPPPPPAVEQCRELVMEEKSLGGWGKRTKRLPRQRCQNGGNHHSLALKC